MDNSTTEKNLSGVFREFFCDLCSLEFSTRNDLDEHCWTLLHHRKLDEKKGRNCSHRCDLCDQEFFGLLAFTTHIHGEKHEAAVQKWRTEQRWNEWSFTSEKKLEDESVVFQSPASTFKKAYKKTVKNPYKWYKSDNSSRGGFSGKDGKQQVERKSSSPNKSVSSSNQNRDQGLCGSDKNQSDFRKWQDSFENKNNEPQKETISNAKPRNSKRQKFNHDFSSDGFSDYFDKSDVNYQDFEGKLWWWQRFEPKGKLTSYLQETKADNEISTAESVTKDSSCVRGSESHIEYTTRSATSVVNSVNLGSRGCSKESEQNAETNRRNSFETSKDYGSRESVKPKDSFDDCSAVDKSDKNSEGVEESMTSGNLYGSRSTEPERRNSRKRKPQKLLAKKNLDAERNKSGLVLSADNSLVCISSDSDSFNSPIRTNSGTNNKTMKSGSREEREKRLLRHRKYEKEMESRMAKIQQNATSNISSFLDNISTDLRKNSLEAHSDVSAVSKPDNLSSTCCPESAGKRGVHSSSENATSDEKLKPDMMLGTSNVVDSAVSNETGICSTLSGEEREELLRSALGIKKEPKDPTEEISTTSFCSAVIKKERESPGIESFGSADGYALCVSNEATTVQGSLTLASSTSSPAVASMANGHVALTTSSISPLQPQCIFVQADGSHCGAVKWKGGYCNYHWWKQKQEKDRASSLRRFSSSSAPLESKSSAALTVGSRLLNPTESNICLPSDTSATSAGLSVPPSFRFATLDLAATAKFDDISKVVDKYKPEMADTNKTLSPKVKVPDIAQQGEKKNVCQIGEIDLNETSPKFIKGSQTSKAVDLGDSIHKRFMNSQLRPRRASTGVREEDRFDGLMPSVNRMCSVAEVPHGRFSNLFTGRRSPLIGSINSKSKVPQTNKKEGSLSALSFPIKQEVENDPVHYSGVGMIDLNDSTELLGRPHHLHAKSPSEQDIQDTAGSKSSVIRFGTSPPKVFTTERKSSVSSLDRSSVSPVDATYSNSGGTREFGESFSRLSPSPSPKKIASKLDIVNRPSLSTKSQFSPGGEVSGALRFPKSSGDSPKGSLTNVSLDLAMTNLPPAIRRALALRHGSKKGDGENASLPITVAPNISKSRSRFVERSKVQPQTQTQVVPQVDNTIRAPPDNSGWAAATSIASAKAIRARRSVSLDSRPSLHFEHIDFISRKQNCHKISPIATSENEPFTSSATKTKSTNRDTKPSTKSSPHRVNSSAGDHLNNNTNSTFMDLSATSYISSSVSSATNKSADSYTYAPAKLKQCSPVSILHTEKKSFLDDSGKSPKKGWSCKGLFDSLSLSALPNSVSGLISTPDNHKPTAQFETLHSNVSRRPVSPLVSHTASKLLKERGTFENRLDNVPTSLRDPTDTHYRDVTEGESLTGVQLTEMMDLSTKPYVTLSESVKLRLVEDSVSTYQKSPLKHKRTVSPEHSSVKRICNTDKMNTDDRILNYASGVNVDGLLRLEREEQDQMQSLNSVQARLKLVRSRIQKLCTELDSLHSEENRIVARMSQLRSARLQILQHAVCKQRLGAQGVEENTIDDKHSVTLHDSSNVELDVPLQRSHTKDGASVASGYFSSNLSKDNYSERFIPGLDVGLNSTSSLTNVTQGITHTEPGRTLTPEKKVFEQNLNLGVKQSSNEFGETTSSGLTTKTVVENKDTSYQENNLSFGRKLKKRRSMSLDDRDLSVVAGEGCKNENTESKNLMKNDNTQELSQKHAPNNMPNDNSSLIQTMKENTSTVETSSQDQSSGERNEAITSVENGSNKHEHQHNTGNTVVESNQQNVKEKRKEEHRADALRKMNQLHYPKKLPLQSSKRRKHSFSDVRVSSTIAQSKEKLESVKQKIESWKRKSQDMKNEAPAEGPNNNPSVESEATNSKESRPMEYRRKKRHDHERRDAEKHSNSSDFLTHSLRSSTGDMNNKTTKELKKSSLFHSSRSARSKEKRRKRDRHVSRRRSQNEHSHSAKKPGMEKPSVRNRRSRHSSREGQPKRESHSVTDNTPVVAGKVVEAGTEADEVLTRDEPSSSSLDVSGDKDVTHLRIPTSTVNSFRKHIVKSLGSKSQGNIFASKFVGHTSAVCGIQICEGRLFTCSADKTSRSFDIQTGECLKTYQGHHQAVNCLQVSTDRQKLFTGSNDQSVRSYNIKSGTCSHKFTFNGRVMCLHTAFDLLFVGLSTGVVASICLKSNTCVDRLHCHEPRGVSCLTTATEKQRRLLCTGSYDSTVSIRDQKSGLLLKTLNGHQMTVLCLQVVENVIYSGAADKNALAHNINTGEKVRSYDGHEASVTGLQVVGRVVITSCLDKLVRCFDLMSSELLQVYGGHTDMIFCVHMANGRIYTGSRDGNVTSVKLDLRVYRPCKWKDCELNFGIVSHLQDHVREYHVMQQGNLERCQWLGCNQTFSHGDEISVVLKHVLNHVEPRSSRNAAS